MPEEKELTIEEMKSLVSLATLLPALLEKISSINKDVAELKASFNEIKTKFNTNTQTVIDYKESVDKLIDSQPNIEQLNKNIETINVGISTLLKLSVPSLAEPVEQKPVAPKSPEKGVKKEKDEDKDKVIEIVDRILADHKGRKTRMITTVDIKKGFKVDDIVAAKVLKWLEDKKMYSSKTHILTFPKR